MKKIIACKAPYGKGGMGGHLAQLVEEARSQGELDRYYSRCIRPGDEDVGESLGLGGVRMLIQFTPVRYSAALSQRVQLSAFDRAVASRLRPGVEVFSGFAGQCLRSAKAARRNGAARIEVHSATPHIYDVKEKTEDAVSRRQIEPSAVDDPTVSRILKEYEVADLIYVNSELTRQSFLTRGFPESSLVRTVLVCDPRFRPAAKPTHEERFNIVYVGSLTVAKGVPDLIDAFQRFDRSDATLTLVGGWGTRGMRRYLQETMAADSRIQVAPGDPLPHFRKASVAVHPSYQDGFGYAPMEAYNTGIPVIVSSATGMKESVEEGVTGFIVEPGDIDALVDRLAAIYADRETWLSHCRALALQAARSADGVAE